VWVAKKLEFINAEQCQRLVMNQQSADWEHPVGGQTSWHRADEVWVSTLDGTARKVLRVIRQRDGLSKDLDAAVRIQVEYELKEHEKLSGRTYDRTRRDIEVAYNALVEGSTLVRDGTKLGPRFFESKLTKLDAYLEESEPGTPFREAIIAARRSLEAARRGDVAPQPTPTQTPIGVSVVPWPQPGQLAPPLRYGNASLAERRGKPVVLVFFKPDSETTDLALAIADALQKRYGEDAPVIALSLGDVATALKDRNRLKLTVPIHEGLAAAAAYGVETVPRFALIDPDGKVKWTFTGVGAETGFLLREQVERLIRPGPPNGPGGIIPAPGSTTTPVIPRP
jgi:peroxiredoxin